MRMGEIEIPGIVTDMLAVTESPPVDCPSGCIDRCNASYDGQTTSYYCKKVNSIQSFVLSLIDKSPNLPSLYLLLRVAPATSSVVCKKVNDTVSVWMNVYIQVVMNIIEFTAGMGASGGFSRRTKSSEMVELQHDGDIYVRKINDHTYCLKCISSHCVSNSSSTLALEWSAQSITSNSDKTLCDQ